MRSSTSCSPPPASLPLQSSARGAGGGATLTTDTGPAGDVPPAAQTAAKSVVELQADTPHGTVRLLGVAVAEGGMVATTADLLTGVRSIAMVDAGGKLEQASVVGTDTTSDVALVEVPEDLPVAPFADDASLAGGAPDMVLGLAVTPGGTAVALRAALRARSPPWRRTSRPGPPTAWTPSCRRPR